MTSKKISLSNKVVALIPARSGSKRIKDKNLRKINGIPLIGYAIEQALSSNEIDEVFVSTDSEAIANISKSYGASVPFIRPKEIAQDDSLDIEVFKHFLNWYEHTYEESPELLVQIRPTAPLRDIAAIDESIISMKKNPKADSLRSISKPHQSPYKMWTLEGESLKPLIGSMKKRLYDMPTQNLPKTFEQDGFIDIIRPETIKYKNSMAGDFIIGFKQHEFGVDIDEYSDLIRAEIHMKNIKKPTVFNSKRILKGRFGILQGRLSNTIDNKLQFLPDNWISEFDSALEIGFGHIEFFRDKEFNKNNILWSKNVELIEKIKNIQIKTGIVVRGICDDYIMKCNWNSISNENLHNLIDLIIVAGKISVNYIVYPLMENASIKEPKSRNASIKVIQLLCDVAKSFGINIYIESNLKSNILKSFIEDINRDNIKLCLDTGNLIYEKINPIDEIYKLKHLIGHIHIKDKNAKGDNVILGTGQLNLDLVFKALKDINYNEYLTFETTRGDNCLETSKYNINLVNMWED